MNSTLSNTYNLLKNKKKLTIGFLGGSITYGSSAERVIENGQFIPDKKGDISDSYANRVVNWFKSQYPDAQIEAVNSGVAGTHSQLGLYRLEKTLMNECGHSMPDLIFIEFTSNDWIYPEHTAEITKTEVESLVVNIRKINPFADIIILATNVKNISISQTKQVHKAVAVHYNLPFIDVGEKLQNLKSTDKESAFKESSETKTLKYTVDNLHPSALGYKIYFDEIISVIKPLLDNCTIEQPVNLLENHPSSLTGKLITPKMINADDIPAPPQSEIVDYPLPVTLYGTNLDTTDNYVLTEKCLILKQNEILNAQFEGKQIGILVELQRKINLVLQFSIDDGEWETFNLDECGLGFEKYKHTQAFMLKTNLSEKTHTIKLKSLTETPVYLGALLA